MHISSGHSAFFLKLFGSRIVLPCLLLSLLCPAPLSAQNRRDAISALFDPQIFAALEQRWGEDAGRRVAAWQTLLLDMDAQSSSGGAAGRKAANDFFNAVPWLTDLEHWGVEDYWATPMETLASNGGDCEDYSIGKYFTLRITGVEDIKLRLTYVKSLQYNQAHMVLAYYDSPDAEPLILDNINQSILPASQRPDLLPVYGFNAEGLWLAKSRRSLYSGEGGLPQWQKLLQRLQQNGGF